MDNKWDLFISHASEDKKTFVRPLASTLKNLGVSVWYDEFTLKLGDSLSSSLDKGLSQSKFGLVVVSHSFIKKKWTNHELRGLVAREINEDSLIIPVWFGITHNEVINFSPTLADKIALKTEDLTAEDIARQIVRVVRPDIYKSISKNKLEISPSLDQLQLELQNAKELLKKTEEELSEYLCPTCGSHLSLRIDAPADFEQKHWDVREIYECGYQNFGGYTEQLCPHDPRFPKFEDYELEFHNNPEEPYHKWVCYPFAKTEMSKKVSLSAGYGTTIEEAQESVYQKYLQYATKKA